MGITIHYNGTLKSASALPKLIEEVKDIAEIYKWKYFVPNDKFPPNSFRKRTFDHHIYGIVFTPPECEAIPLTFLSNGKLTSPWSLNYYLEKKDESLLGSASVKTHYAGVSIHKLVIHLLDHLSKKYFRHFKLMDEAQYWEARDEKLLVKNFKVLNGLIKSFSIAIETQPMQTGETFEKYIERISNQIHSERNKSTE